MEGLMTSLVLTARHLFENQSLEGLDPQREANAKLMLHDLLVMMIAMLLGILLFSKDRDTPGDKST